MQKKLLSVIKMLTKFVLYGSVFQVFAVTTLFGFDTNEFRNETSDTKSDLELRYEDRDISGKILDENGEGLPGAAILVKGTSNGTVTDLDGNFQLSIPEGATLAVSFVGYLSQDVVADNKSVYEIRMKVDAAQLDEVVVIGYGTVRKQDLTGAISSISEKDFNVGPIASVEQLLQGKTAGVLISTQSSEPGGDFIMRIRGNNSVGTNNQPIYVVDGFPMENLNNSINPADIQSIEILKDASATAIYGTRGANGVVIITTKKGVIGETRINYSYESGFQKLANLDAYDFNDALGYANSVNDVEQYLNGDDISGRIGYDADRLAYIEEYWGPEGGTDWLNELFQDGRTQSHQISVSAGSEKSKIYVGGGYFKLEGVVPNTDFSRYTTRINLDQYISDKLKMGITSNIGYTKSSFLGFNASNLQTNVMNDIFIRANPIMPVDYETLTQDEIDNLFTSGQRPVNPLTNATLPENESQALNVLANTYLQYEIIEGLNFKTSLGTRFRQSKSSSYVPISSPNVSIGGGATNPGDANISHSQTIDILFENTLNYAKVFNADHSLNALIGFTTQQIESEFFGAGTTGITSSTGAHDLGAGGIPSTPSSAFFSKRYVSYLGRINYAYADRYLLTLSYRRDGSTEFPENTWGNFPAAAVAWKIHNESFMSGVSLLSQFKVRVGYGITGSDRFRNDLAHKLFDVSNPVDLGGVSDLSRGAVLQIGNKNLQWEETKQLNVGLDVGLWKDRVSMSLDYYDKSTDKLILNKNLAPSFGVATILQNVGEVRNSGFEIQLNTNNIQGGALTWSTSFNYSYNKNEVKSIDLPEGAEFINGPSIRVSGYDWTPYTIIKPGEAVNSFFGYVYEGVDATTGAAIFKDLNGRDENGNLTGVPDGQIDGADRTILGSGYPDLLLGLTNTVGYKNISLSFTFTGTFGVSLLNLNKILGYNNNTLASSQDRWTPERLDGTEPLRWENNGTWMNSKWVENGDFVRLKNVSLSYALPIAKLNQDVIKSLEIYVTGTNLVTWTDYSGFDPEISGRVGLSDQSTNLNVGAGVDNFGYPNQRTFSLGVKLGL